MDIFFNLIKEIYTIFETLFTKTLLLIMLGPIAQLVRVDDS